MLNLRLEVKIKYTAKYYSQYDGQFYSYSKHFGLMNSCVQVIHIYDGSLKIWIENFYASFKFNIDDARLKKNI